MTDKSSATIIGLTGGIGSGKTTVANCFAERGITLVDTDLIARQVVEPGQSALLKIADHFGAQTLNADGSLNRTELRHKVFADPNQRRWLEQLTHPLIRQATLQQLQQAKSDYVILVSALLLETDQHQLCDHILVVDVPESIQIERTVQRDSNTTEQVKAIIAAQCERQKRLEQAGSVIDNTQPLSQLAQQVDRLDQKFRALADNPTHKAN
ncbi:MAG: dephospho-CoA kinase [Motiliproteus sp.]